MISVLLPYRNAAPTLEEAIASVLAERDVDLELVAIDDGSTDASASIVERIARSDRRVVPVYAGDFGIVRGLSVGLQHARGNLVGRMDADDISIPGRFAAARARIEQGDGVAVVGVQVEGFPEVGPGLARFIAWQNSLVTRADHAAAIFVESPVCHPTVLIERRALDAVGGYREGPFPEDYELWLRMDAAGYGFAKVDRVLFRWRHQTGRMTFADPRCSLDSFLRLRALHLARRLRERARPFAIWGAGKTGRHLARALEAHDLRPAFFIDIDPRKIGRTARGAQIREPETVRTDRATIVVAVGAPGARDVVRERLRGMGLVEGADFVCAA